MILVGNQRGGAKDLAQHLMSPENDHVDVHELRGFSAESLNGALNEAYALSRGTNCRKFMFSLSINPPPNKEVSVADFVAVADRAEKRLGLEGQARALVFHEKNGRRHAHCVWSRIDPDQMKAVHLPFTKRKLVDLTRDIFVERGWDIPDGLIDRQKRDPLQFSLAEYQQAKRTGQNPRVIKAAFQSAWASSDSLSALKHALREQGYWLAKGDRRGFVALDHKMKPYALSKWLGVRAKVIRDRLGKPDTLVSIHETEAKISKTMTTTLSRLDRDVERRAALTAQSFEQRRLALVKRQRAMRIVLKASQEQRRDHENKKRQARFRKGVSGVWDRIRGEHARIRRQNQREAYEQMRQDRQARDAMIWRHLQERQRIEIFKMRHRESAQHIRRSLEHDRDQYLSHVSPEPSL